MAAANIDDEEEDAANLSYDDDETPDAANIHDGEDDEAPSETEDYDGTPARWLKWKNVAQKYRSENDLLTAEVNRLKIDNESLKTKLGEILKIASSK